MYLSGLLFQFTHDPAAQSLSLTVRKTKTLDVPANERSGPSDRASIQRHDRLAKCSIGTMFSIE
jgi:hypothetical protein